MMWSLFLLASTYALPLDKLGAKDCYGYGNCEGWGAAHCLDDETLNPDNLESTECSQSTCCSRPEAPEEFTKMPGKSCSKSKLGPRFYTASSAKKACKVEGKNCRGYYVHKCDLEKFGRIFKLCEGGFEYTDSDTSCVFDKIDKGEEEEPEEEEEEEEEEKKEEVLDCGKDGNIGTPWTCTGCPPAKKGDPCEAKRLAKSEMVRGICADDFTCVEEAACPPAEQRTKEAGCCPLDRIYDNGKKCCPAGEKSSATGCTALPPPPPPPPAKLVEVAEKAEETACPPAEQRTKEAGCCPLDRIYDNGKKCCPAGEKSSATGCTALPPPPPPPPMLAEKTEGTVLDCGEDGNLLMPWTCIGCPPDFKGEPCEAKQIGRSKMVRGICADDFTCACPPAEQLTKEAGCCPLDRIYDDGKKCCPAGEKSSADGCTALPPPPPPPPMLAEKTEETAKDCYGYDNCAEWGAANCLDHQTLNPDNRLSTECSQGKCCSNPEEFTKMSGKSCSKSKLGPRFYSASSAKAACKVAGKNCSGYYVHKCDLEKFGRIFKLCDGEFNYTDSDTSCVFDKNDKGEFVEVAEKAEETGNVADCGDDSLISMKWYCAECPPNSAGTGKLCKAKRAGRSYYVTGTCAADWECDGGDIENEIIEDCHQKACCPGQTHGLVWDGSEDVCCPEDNIFNYGQTDAECCTDGFEEDYSGCLER